MEEIRIEKEKEEYKKVVKEIMEDLESRDLKELASKFRKLCILLNLED